MQVAGAVSVIAGGVAGAGWLARGAWLASRAVHRLADDLLGDEERGRPGVVSRLDDLSGRVSKVEHELQPNSGFSLRDAVDRVEVRQIRTDQRLDQHLTVHDRT